MGDDLSENSQFFHTLIELNKISISSPFSLSQNESCSRVAKS